MTQYDKLSLLEKIANDLPVEPMLEDPQPQPSEAEVAAAQAENDLLMQSGIPSEAVEPAQLTEEEQLLLAQDAAAQQVDQEIAEEAAQELAVEEALVNADDTEVAALLSEKVASEMYAAGTIAKLVECSRGVHGEDLEKQANEILSEMVTSPEAFDFFLEKTAEELFGLEENARDLFSKDGVVFTFEQLAYLESDELEKTANPNSALNGLKVFASKAIGEVKQKIGDALQAANEIKDVGVEAVRSATNLGAIKKELDPLRAQTSELAGRMEADINSVDHAQYGEMLARQQELARQQLHGRTALGVGAGLGAAAGIGAGVAAHNHFNGEEKIATVLPGSFDDGTLDLATQSELNGGIQKMSKELVQDFLKVAGAAGLIGIVNNEELDIGIRKEASEAFDYIAGLGHTDMGNEFAKVATRIYDENELHEIVAGFHTEELLEKVAFFTDALEESNDSLEKIANAGGVSLIKSVGAGLKNATTHIGATVDKAKEAAQGAGRQYVGALKGEAGKGKQVGAIAGTGLAGGGLVAGGMAGYNMINNPEQYDVDKTASILEEAQMLKEAAERVIRSYQG